MSRHNPHRSHRNTWLRAAVLGANDGIVSTASLIIGFAFAGADASAIVLAGLAGLVAGAMSMAAGEYVSVSSQADTEKADLEQEQRSLERDYDYEHRELTRIYVSRGLERELAKTVATQLMDYDALAAHARDEIGITTESTPRPLLAAISSAGTFTVGAMLPLVTVLLTPPSYLLVSVAISALVFLAGMGAIAAKIGGASAFRGAARVTIWGALAMLATSLVGHLFGVSV